MSSREAKLEALGYPLDRVPTPGATYEPVVIHDGIAYVSGAIPFDGPGNLVHTGKVGQDLDLSQGQKAAELCAANVLRVLRQALGSLGYIERILKVGGYVNSAPGFTDQHLVINGASELFIGVLGEAGRHSRAAIGVAQLPLDSAVEVDAIVQVKA